MNVQISNPREHLDMGFTPAKGVSSGTTAIHSGFSLQHNFGCDHADATLPHTPSAQMGDNKK